MPGAAMTAEAVLQRLLLVLPLAAREEGARIQELAEALELSPRTLLRDLEVLQSRSYYLSAGLGDQFQLTLTREHLKVWTTGEFQRPPRLTPREGLAVELALRIMARDTREAGRYPGRETEVHTRLLAALRSPEAKESGDPAVSLGGAEARPDSLRNTVEEALRLGKEVTIRYRPPGREAATRRVGPILLVHAEGRWYLVARDLEQKALRAFRLDRVLDAEVLGEGFVPSTEEGVAAERFLQDGRVHDGGEENPREAFEAVVDYSPRIARWIRERGWEDTEELGGGGIRVRHSVLDPEWLLRHTLSYGAEARILEPDWMRERLVETVRRMVGSGGTATPP